MNDFVSEDDRHFRFKIGKYIASSLSGFIAGVIVASLVWGLVIYLFKITP